MLWSVIIFILGAGHLSAQVPSLLEYDGYMSGNITGNRTIGVRLYSASKNGTLLYRENVGTVKVTQGQFYFQYGQNGTVGNATTSLASALTGSQQWLALTVNGTEQSPRERLVAVPYALKSGDGQKLTQEVMGLTGNVSTLRSAQSALSSNVTTLSMRVTAASSNASAALGTANALSGNVTTLMNVQNALSANVTTLMNVQNALSTNVTTLRNQVTSASSNASAALQMVVNVGNATTLMNEKNELSANVTTLLAMVQSLRKELEEVNAFEIMISVQGGTLPQSSELKGQTVAAFQIGNYEVTWGLWKRVRDWAVNNRYSDLAGVGAGNGDNFPVTNVSWYDVVKWCNARSEKEGLTPVYVYNGNFTYNGTTYGNGTTYKAGQTVPTVNASANGYRLPSEKEWEWAARGGVNSKNYTYSGSNTAIDVAWMAENSSDETKMVGTKSANELGFYDMSGNVWEWCWDLHLPSGRRTRGGDWGSASPYVAVAFRFSLGNELPDVRLRYVGFRLARSSGN